MRPSTLVIGYGNPSRGDDALAPLLLEALGERLDWSGKDVELLTDFQLQIEHVLDLEGRRRVVFVDAAWRGPEPFSFDVITAAADPAPMTHAMSPSTLLSVFRNHFGTAAPESWLLAIRGYSFVLGDGLSDDARGNFNAALTALLEWMVGAGTARGGVPVSPLVGE